MASIDDDPERSQWSDLLPDLLGQIIARLPAPILADHARFRAVCRSWHSAVRMRISAQKHHLPSIVLPDGTYLTPFDSGTHRLHLPNNTRCVGSTADWLALERVDDVTGARTYTLHNPFSGATVPLKDLDSVLGKVSKEFRVRKVLMRSTPDDLIAVIGNTWKHPLVLCRHGKGAWVARLKAMPYFRIIDVAFLGDKLCAITMAEDLFVLHLGEDGDGKPTVTNVKHIIKHAPGHDDDRYYSWPISDVDLLGNEEIDEELDREAPSGDDNYGILSHEAVHDDDTVDHDSDTDNDDNDHLVFDDEWTLPVCEEGVYEGYDAIQITSRHLVESCGKLLMVKRLHHVSAFTPTDHTRKVEVFEADVDTCTWVPIAGVLGNGRAIFIGNRFSYTIPACGEVEEDIMYFPRYRRCV